MQTNRTSVSRFIILAAILLLVLAACSTSQASESADKILSDAQAEMESQVDELSPEIEATVTCLQLAKTACCKPIAKLKGMRSHMASLRMVPALPNSLPKANMVNGLANHTPTSPSTIPIEAANIRIAKTAALSLRSPLATERERIGRAVLATK